MEISSQVASQAKISHLRSSQQEKSPQHRYIISECEKNQGWSERDGEDDRDKEDGRRQKSREGEVGTSEMEISSQTASQASNSQVSISHLRSSQQEKSPQRQYIISRHEKNQGWSEEGKENNDSKKDLKVKRMEEERWVLLKW